MYVNNIKPCNPTIKFSKYITILIFLVEVIATTKFVVKFYHLQKNV